MHSSFHHSCTIPLVPFLLASTVLSSTLCSGTEIDDLLAKVEEKFAAIETLELAVDVVHFPVGDGVSGTPVATHRTWKSKGDAKRLFSYTERYAFGETPGHPLGLVGFDGESKRTIMYDAEPPGDQAKGFLDPSPPSWNETESKWIQLSECLRAWGMEINGYSLVEWLQSPVISARSSSSGELTGLLVEVLGTPDSPGTTESDYRSEFFFAEKYNYALVEFSSYIDNELSMTILSTDFQEIADGVWFPIAGAIIPGEKRVRENPELATYEFRVAHVQANHDIPDSLFVPEFDPQVDVLTPLQDAARLELERMQKELPDAAMSGLSAQDPTAEPTGEEPNESAVSSYEDDHVTEEKPAASNPVLWALSLIIAFPVAIVAMRYLNRRRG